MPACPLLTRIDCIATGPLLGETLQRALTIQAANRKRRLGEILVTLGVVSLRAIVRAQSEALGIRIRAGH